MTVRLWFLLSLTWVLIVGGGGLVTGWMETGRIDPPNSEPVFFDDADLWGDGDCDRHYGDSPAQRSALDNCRETKSGQSRTWRVALVQFLALVFGPPLALGFIILAQRMLRRTAAVR